MIKNIFRYVWHFFNKPRGYFSQFQVKLFVNVYKREEFPDLRDFPHHKDLLAKDFFATTLSGLCRLFFVVTSHDIVFIIQDYTKRQPEYTILTEKILTKDEIQAIYDHLPAKTIVFFRTKEMNFATY